MGSSLESRNPSTLEKPTCNHHCYSGILLSSWFFPFGVPRKFCVYACFLRFNFTIPLHYFGAWIDSLRIYPLHLVLSLRSLVIQRFKSNTLTLLQSTLAQQSWLAGVPPDTTSTLLTNAIHRPSLANNSSRW